MKRGIPTIAILLLLVSFPLTGTAWATNVLFLGDSAPPPSIGADATALAYLQTRYGMGNVTYGQASAFNTGDELAYDVLLISSTPGSGAMRDKWEDSPIGIVNWEEAIMDDSAVGEFFLSETITKDNPADPGGDHIITLNSAGHPIQAGLPNGDVTIVTAAAGGGDEILYSTDADGAGVFSIGFEQGDPNRRFLQYAEAGAALLGDGSPGSPSIAAGRRVSFPITDSTFDNLTPEGLTLFGNSVDWALNVVPEPSSFVLAALGVVGVALVGWRNRRRGRR